MYLYLNTREETAAAAGHDEAIAAGPHVMWTTTTSGRRFVRVRTRRPPYRSPRTAGRSVVAACVHDNNTYANAVDRRPARAARPTFPRARARAHPGSDDDYDYDDDDGDRNQSRVLHNKNNNNNIRR